LAISGWTMRVATLGAAQVPPRGKVRWREEITTLSVQRSATAPDFPWRLLIVYPEEARLVRIFWTFLAVSLHSSESCSKALERERPWGCRKSPRGRLSTA
jgi:hypothetical protein